METPDPSHVSGLPGSIAMYFSITPVAGKEAVEFPPIRFGAAGSDKLCVCLRTIPLGGDLTPGQPFVEKLSKLISAEHDAGRLVAGFGFPFPRGRGQLHRTKLRRTAENGKYRPIACGPQSPS